MDYTSTMFDFELQRAKTLS